MHYILIASSHGMSIVNFDNKARYKAQEKNKTRGRKRNRKRINHGTRKGQDIMEGKTQTKKGLNKGKTQTKKNVTNYYYYYYYYKTPSTKGKLTGTHEDHIHAFPLEKRMASFWKR